MVFNDTAATEIYTLSLHDALPIYLPGWHHLPPEPGGRRGRGARRDGGSRGRPDPAAGADHPDLRRSAADRKSTRLNSSHANISYAVFCLKKKHTYLLPYLSSSLLL